MINELKVLSDSIKTAGFSGIDWENKFGEIKLASPCFVLELNEAGAITGIRFLSPEKAKVLRTWTGGSNGECFPAFNFQPFFSFVSEKDKEKKTSPKQKNDALAGVIEKIRKVPTVPDVEWPLQAVDRLKPDKKAETCLGKIANDFFGRVCHGYDASDVLVRFRDAFNRFIGSENRAETFNRALVSYLHENFVRNSNSDELKSLLVSGTDAVVFFDMAVSDAVPIASERTMRIINERLLATKDLLKAKGGKRSKSELTKEADAFGNKVNPKEFIDKLPEVKLPGVIANTKLRSMSSESKCQMRYGRIDAESFPVGNEIRKATKSALAWISSQEREGSTWAIAGANELVFAYPKKLPAEPPRLARLLGNGRKASLDANDASVSEARFEAYAKAALQGLRTLSQGAASNTDIEVFAIKKADKARRKVVFYRNYSLERLELAVNDWNEGAKNIPPITLRRWPLPPKGEKLPKGTLPVPMEFHAPLPLSAIEIAYSNWSQDGNEKAEPKFRVEQLFDGIPIFDGLELFLGDSITIGLARRMLSLLLQNSSRLCTSSGNLAHKRNVISNIRAVRYLETVLPLFGILLHKLDHNKEIYMENTPYLIGRFLNLADGLHAVWCKNVRDNQIPPQLLGSSLFASFQMNPVQAFGNASLRIKPYLDWAKTNKSQDAALSRWFLGEFGRVCTAIKATGIPQRLSDTDKAEMLLGYLASSGKQDESEPSQHEPSK